MRKCEKVWESVRKYEEVWSDIFRFRIFAASFKENDAPVLKGRKDTITKKMHYDSESNKNEHRWEAAIIASVPNHHSGFKAFALTGRVFKIRLKSDAFIP